MKKLLKKVLLVYLCLGLLMIGAFQLIFDISEHPRQLLIGQSQSETTATCYQNTSPQPIDSNGILNVLVWNIYKQNRDNWQRELDQFSQQAQLLLLQEASLTDEFKGWIEKQSWDSNYVSAFSAFNTSSGVVNLANSFPITACAYNSMEPWIKLPKSGLYALYQLSNGQELAVVNVHAINFTLGTREYQQQIKALRDHLMLHAGPIIMAGDFNTWSEERLTKLIELTSVLDLHEVEFTPDKRTQFLNGMPLDHIFYKRLELLNAKAPITEASDHNPLIAKFKIF